MGRAEGWTRLRTAALLVNAVLLGVGNCANPLLTRLYFIGGGTRIWFSAWLQTAAWPVTFIPLLVSYLHHRRRRSQTSDSGEFQHITPFLFISAALIGLLMGLNNYLFTYGVSKLPVSTVLLIGSSQLGFTSVFAFFLVNQKFTAFTINAVILLTLSAVVLGVRAGNDRPAGESNKEYILGFASTAGSAALLGLVFPLVELSYSKAKKAKIEYSMVLEFQMVLCFAATLVCTLGMFINHDFEVISREAREYELGKTKYFLVIVGDAILTQFFYVGALGATSYGSSLLSMVIITVLLPITELMAVVFYHEKFQAEKGISLFLSLWGFVSYFYGDIKNNIKKKNPQPATMQWPDSLCTTCQLKLNLLNSV
ncbi:unnamed protein product [Cuscuta epithymum]|uniref:Probable purine permease n=1 Tax=Cuscuta epithymum TaxID=186058 RepID=A0AAV0C6S1_9ASTE|nr:unnamed protein product [Cuscuta epithymum]